MNPQSVTIGARLGARLNRALILPAAAAAPDRVTFFGGLLASIIGAGAGLVGPQTTAELLRTCLARLDGQPQLELPAGVRLAIASASEVKAERGEYEAGQLAAYSDVHAMAQINETWTEPGAAANDSAANAEGRIRAAAFRDVKAYVEQKIKIVESPEDAIAGGPDA